MGKLTKRESQVMAGVRQGLTAKQLARINKGSTRTVEVHISNIINKMWPDRRRRRQKQTLALLLLRDQWEAGYRIPVRGQNG